MTEWYKQVGPDVTLALLIWGEAEGETMDGQLAVANVAMNRVKHWRWPDDLFSVMFQPYQFEGWDRVAQHQPFVPSDRLMTIAQMALRGLAVDVSDGATHFFADSYQGDLRKKLEFVRRIGGHDFYLER